MQNKMWASFHLGLTCCRGRQSLLVLSLNFLGHKKRQHTTHVKPVPLPRALRYSSTQGITPETIWRSSCETHMYSMIHEMVSINGPCVCCSMSFSVDSLYSSRIKRVIFEVFRITKQIPGTCRCSDMCLRQLDKYKHSRSMRTCFL